MRGEITQMAVEAHDPSKLSLEVRFEVPEGRSPCFLSSLTGRLLVNDLPIGEHVVPDPQRMRDVPSPIKAGSFKLGMYTHVNRRAVDSVEAGLRTADLGVRLELTSCLHEAVEHKQVNQVWTYAAGATVWNALHCAPYVLLRSHWLTMLQNAKLYGVECFEVRVPVPPGDAVFRVALERLRDAEGAARRGDWSQVIGLSRNAIEALAKHANEGDNVKDGIRTLLASAFPGDARRQDLYDGLLNSLRQLCQTIGRHEQYPPIEATRSEAELVLAAHLRIFALLGDALTRPRS